MLIRLLKGSASQQFLVYSLISGPCFYQERVIIISQRGQDKDYHLWPSTLLVQSKVKIKESPLSH